MALQSEDPNTDVTFEQEDLNADATLHVAMQMAYFLNPQEHGSVARVTHTGMWRADAIL